MKRRFLQWAYPNINARIVGPFLLTIVLVAGIGVYIVTRLVAGSLQERFSNQLLDSARAATNNITDIEREQLATLRSMVFTEGIPQAVEEQNTSQLETLLRPIATNAHIDDVIVFDQHGESLFQLTRQPSVQLTYEVMPPPDISEWDGVSHILERDVDLLGDKHTDIAKREAEAIIYISAPVKNEDEAVIGGISVGIQMQRMVELVSEQSLSSVAFFDDGGALLGSTFRSITPTELGLDPENVQNLVVTTNEFSPVEDRDIQGSSYQIMYAPLSFRSQQVGLLVVGLPTNFIVERIGTSRNWFTLLFSGLFVGIGTLGLVVARTIIRPVQRLVDTTRAIRDGDLTRRVELHTPDELGELALSFDHMTSQLVQRNAEVEDLYHQQVEQTAQREAMLTSIGDAVVVQDLQGNILLRNQALDNLYILADRNPGSRQILNTIRQRPEDFQAPHSIALGDNHFSVLAKEVCLSGNALLGHVIVFRDISALIKSERLKDEMLLQISHELRTPLTAVRGFAELVVMIESPHMSEQGQGFANKTVEHLTTLESMINEVIDVSAVLANRFELSIEPVNLEEIIHSRTPEWETWTQKRELTLTVSLPESNTLNLAGDSRRLTQVLNHIIQNACNYTLPGGTIEVGVAPKDGRIHIYVIDSGVGIAPDELTHVFDRLYRGRSADAGPTDARGLGLGLYLSKYIVEAHHGTIHLDSKIDYGTVVSIELPVSQ